MIPRTSQGRLCRALHLPHLTHLASGPRALAATLPLVSLFATAASLAQEPSAPAPAPEPDPAVEEIVVRGQVHSPAGEFTVSPTRATPNAPDSAKLLTLIPGADVVDNGPLTGQAQYRGMFGNRVDVRIDDMHISPGGPNWMDPPLQYAPRALVKNLSLIHI